MECEPAYAGDRGASSGFTLLALPADIVMHILNYSAIGARELCRLESTCHSMRFMIDDQLWRRAFLAQRRCNALHEPSCWKQEFARRDSWSRGWRQLVSTPDSSSSNCVTRVGGHAQKFRRFALKILNAAPSVVAPRATVELTVDPLGLVPGSYRSITEALSHTRPFDAVLVHPGTYVEKLHLRHPVELVGQGALGSVTIVGVDGPAIEASSRLACRLARLSLQQCSNGDGGAMSGAVLIKGGALVIVEDCMVSSETGHCIVMQGADSCGYILHNEVQRGKGVGVLVCDSAKGVIEDNTISCNGRAGIAILSGGDPLVRGNKIFDGMDSGVLISEKGKGRVEDNDIFNNRRAGVAILKEGAPLVKRNRIHDGRDSGVLVCENGKGSVVDNDIFANQMAGVAIGRGGASQITGNVIRDGHGGSLCLSAHSRGLISANVIHQDPRAAMQVPEGLMVDVQEHNLIRYSVTGEGGDMALDAPCSWPQCHAASARALQQAMQQPIVVESMVH